MIGNPLISWTLTQIITAETTDDMELVNVTDYGSLPNFESPLATPFHQYLRLGPGLSVRFPAGVCVSATPLTHSP